MEDNGRDAPSPRHPSSGPTFDDNNFGGSFKSPQNSQGEVVLRVEFMDDDATKLDIGLLRLGLLACLAILILECVWEMRGVDSLHNDTKNQLYTNLVLSSLCLAALSVTTAVFVYRIVDSARSHRVWSPRRRRVCVLAAIDLGSIYMTTVFYLLQSAYAFSTVCGWASGPVKIFSLLRWLFFGVFLSNQVLQAIMLMPILQWVPLLHRLRLISSEGEAQAPDESSLHMGIDLPRRLYIAVVRIAAGGGTSRSSFLFLVLYTPYFIVLLMLGLDSFGVFGNNFACTDINDERCHPQENIFRKGDCSLLLLMCETNQTDHALTIAIACWVMIHIPLYFYMLYTSRRQLRRLPYQEYRTSLIELGIQIRTRLLVAIFLFLSFILLWLITINKCSINKTAWLGMAPVEVAVAVLAIISTKMHMPCTPQPGEIKLNVWLQDVAWLEEDVPRKLDLRPFTGEPCFCFETVLKLYYFSMLIYEIDEVPNTPYTLDTAMGLYGLTDHHLLWHNELDAKSLICWNVESGTAVLAFRGTASVANVLADLKFWRTPHPPRRGSYWLGTQPLVHTGFLIYWIDSGMRDRVMQLLRRGFKVKPRGGQGRWRVLVTGHSLGGAVAKLAAYDIHARAAELYPDAAIDVSYVTFGCPYVGNTAFAKDLQHAVPDGWDVVLPNDIVANSGKFISMYKRAGFKVLISGATADLIVRPSLIERSVMRSSGKSVHEHLLTTYAQALASVMRAQFDGKELEGGRQGIVKLLQCAYVRKMLDHSDVGLRQHEIPGLEMMIPRMQSSGALTRSSPLTTGLNTRDGVCQLDLHVSRGESMEMRRSATLGRRSLGTRGQAGESGQGNLGLTEQEEDV